MVNLEICPQCEVRKDTFTSEGICVDCSWKNQEESDRRKINASSMPDGFITTWNDSPSYLDKKNNYMYFRIPQTSTLFFDPDKKYQIIVKEVLA